MIYCYYKTHTGYEFAAEYHCDEDAQRAARGLLEKYGFIYADGLGNATPCDIWAALSKNLMTVPPVYFYTREDAEREAVKHNYASLLHLLRNSSKQRKDS